LLWTIVSPKMKTIPALIVKQWLSEWDEAKFEPVPPRGKPEPQFYVCSIPAYELKKLTGIYRRDPNKQPAEDMGIQRSHNPDRSAEILRYLQSGFPLSRIQAKKLVDPSEIPTLRMPGWLPTAIVVNILKSGNQRGVKDREVAPEDLVTVVQRTDSAAEIQFPAKLEDDNWQPVIHPIEVIDGQHRLWALEEPEEQEERWSAAFREKIRKIEIPVIAFHGLDTTWQAYLFYTINQLATRIDTSMVFDLYPLLRTEEWLLRFEGPNIYRQTRAQDLTILLWAHPESPWKDRIIRLGGREKGKISQAAFINSLMSSFIRRYTSVSGTRIGGLFGSRPGKHEIELNWVREQQAAFLIICWKQIRDSVIKTKAPWAEALLNTYARASNIQSEPRQRELLFSGPDTLLATDQGVRGYMNVLNDLLWVANEDQKVDLRAWSWVRKTNQDDNAAISDALRQFEGECKQAMKYVGTVAEILTNFDWRLPSALSHNDPAYSVQAMYRGSSGYSEIRRRMLTFIKEDGQSLVSGFAAQVLEKRGYESEEVET
jgi:DGQHR domain-containing protein